MPQPLSEKIFIKPHLFCSKKLSAQTLIHSFQSFFYIEKASFLAKNSIFEPRYPSLCKRRTEILDKDHTMSSGKTGN